MKTTEFLELFEKEIKPQGYELIEGALSYQIVPKKDSIPYETFQWLFKHMIPFKVTYYPDIKKPVILIYSY